MVARRFAACLVGLGLLATGARAQTLSAGVAQVDITPPNGLALLGYPGEGRFATGTRDPLYARVLVLQAGATRFALVDLDLVFLFGPSYMARLRETAHADVTNLLVAAIHTHSGPNPFASPSSPEDAWETAAVGAVAGAIHRAAANLVPARLGVGYGEAFLGHNRLRVERDGSVIWFEKNWTGATAGTVDPTVAVLRVDDMGGSPIAVL